MRDYTVISKISLAICACLIVLAVINGFTGFLNAGISVGGTVICIVGFCMAIFAIAILEKERAKKKRR